MRRSPPSSPSSETVRFRLAEAGDLAAVAALLADDDIARAPAAAADLRPAFAAIMASPDNEFWVGERDGALVACAQLTLIPGLGRGGGWRAQIEAVRTARARRGEGIGAALIGVLLARARERGADLAQLTSDARRADARRFYERLGFVASHVGFKRRLD